MKDKKIYVIGAGDMSGKTATAIAELQAKGHIVEIVSPEQLKEMGMPPAPELPIQLNEIIVKDFKIPNDELLPNPGYSGVSGGDTKQKKYRKQNNRKKKKRK